MTSREIADLVGSRHNDVKRSIERMLEKGVIKSATATTFKNSNNVLGSEYRFTGTDGRKDAYVITAKLAPQFMGEMVDKWGTTENTLKDLLSALEAFDVPEDFPDDLYLYAIREVETGRIKLGISRNPWSRVKQLQTGNSSPLELVAYSKAVNGYKDESDIHRAVSSHRIRGEWFSSSVLEAN